MLVNDMLSIFETSWMPWLLCSGGFIVRLSSMHLGYSGQPKFTVRLRAWDNNNNKYVLIIIMYTNYVKIQDCCKVYESKDPTPP